MKNILLTITMLLSVVSSSLSAGDFNDFKKSCDAGDAIECTYGGLMYDRGQGVKQNYT